MNEQLSPIFIRLSKTGRQNPQSAFSLVEIAVAMGIAVFCLIVLFGLLPIGLTSNQNAVEQTAAAGLARAIVADLRVGGTSAQSPTYSISLAPGTSTLYLDESGNPTTVTSARYRVNLYLTQLSGGRTATLARVLITWPATLAPTAAAGSYEAVTALDRN